MRRVALLLALALPLGACAGPTVDLDAERASLKAVMDSGVAAEVRFDAAGAAAVWAPDAVVQGHGLPQVEGAAAIRGFYDEFFRTPGLKSFESTSTRVVMAASGDLAYDHGTARVVFATPDGDVADVSKYLTVWQKRDGTWRAVAMSYTSDAPAPVPVATPDP